MSASKARRLSFKAAEQAAKHAGTEKGSDAAVVALAMALLEVAYQVGRAVDTTPIYGPPEERK